MVDPRCGGDFLFDAYVGIWSDVAERLRALDLNSCVSDQQRVRISVVTLVSL